MKIAVLSDLHFEMHRDRGRRFVDTLEPNGADVLVLAGDICAAEHANETLNMFRLRFKRPVVYIPGNHEYYKSSVAAANKTVGKYNCVRREIDGVWFVCATLWFDYDEGTDEYKNSLNDFYLIKDFDPWVFEENKRHVAFLRENVQPGDVVVTHHLPSLKSIHPRYSGSPINRFFVHPMDDLIEERQPALWIHGHTHEPCDYTIGKTRVVANPFGYPGEFRRKWEPKIVEGGGKR